MILAYKGFDLDLSCTSRGNRFQYVPDRWNEEPTAKCGENGFHCRVVEEIENPFSFTVMLLAPGGGNAPVGWETEKHIWREHRAPELEINLPKQSLLLLRE